MNNNKGTVLLLTIIFVLIFSVLGLLSMKLAIMHNNDINKELINVRINYAAESALEQAAFRMALLSNPIKVPTTASNAAVINAVTPSFPSTNTATQTVWFYKSSESPTGTPSQSSATIRQSGGKWSPLHAPGQAIIDNSFSPAIKTTVEVRQLTAAEIKATDGTTQYVDSDSAGTGTGTGFSTATVNSAINTLKTIRNRTFLVLLDENKNKIFQGAGANGINLCVSSVGVTGTNTNSTINFYINYASSSYVDPKGAVDPAYLQDQKNQYYVSGTQHGYPALMRGWLIQMMEEILGNDPTSSSNAKYYVITATAGLETPNPAFPDKTLEFYYVVAGNTTVVLDVSKFSTNVFNNSSFNKGQSDMPNMFQFIQINFTNMQTDPNATGGGTSSTQFSNVFRSRK